MNGDAMRRCQLARVSTATVGRRALGGGRERPNFRVRDFVCVLARRAYDADARNVDAHDGDAVAPSHHAPFRPPPTSTLRLPRCRRFATFCPTRRRTAMAICSNYFRISPVLVAGGRIAERRRTVNDAMMTNRENEPTNGRDAR